jgi:hypothetical protein
LRDRAQALAESLLYHGLPRYQAKTHTVVEHGKPPAGELNIPPVNTADSLTIGDRPIRQACFFRNAQCGCLEVALAQCRKEIASQDGALSAALSQTLLNQEIRSLR